MCYKHGVALTRLLFEILQRDPPTPRLRRDKPAFAEALADKMAQKEALPA